MNSKFEAGINIAIKVPKSKYEKTVAFYRDILKLEVEEKPIDNPTVSRTHQVKLVIISFGWIVLIITPIRKLGYS